MNIKKLQNIGMILLVVYSVWVGLLEDSYKRKLVDIHLKENTAIAKGVLSDHVFGKSSGSDAYSTVQYTVNGEKYIAKMVRLRVKVGIPLDVKYSIDDPNWNRVILPDTLKKYKSLQNYPDDDHYYTWPPNKEHGRIDNENIKGPY